MSKWLLQTEKNNVFSNQYKFMANFHFLDALALLERPRKKVERLKKEFDQRKYQIVGS